MIKIYALIDPRNNYKIYIGKTKRFLNRRLKEHLNDKSNNPKAAWIKSLNKKDLKPEIILLDEVENYVFWEQWWFEYFKFLGFTMLNYAICGSGGGGMKNKKHSEQTKKKMKESAKNINRVWLNDKNKNIFFNKQFQEKQKENRKLNKRKHSEKTKEKLRNINLGKKKSVEWCEMIRENNRGKNNGKAKIVYQYDLNYNLIILWKYRNLAAIQLNINADCISRACNSGKKYKNYYWSWKEIIKN